MPILACVLNSSGIPYPHIPTENLNELSAVIGCQQFFWMSLEGNVHVGIRPMLMVRQKFNDKNNFVFVSVELACHGLMEKCYKKLVGRIKNRIIQPAPGYLLVILPC